MLAFKSALVPLVGRAYVPKVGFGGLAAAKTTLSTTTTRNSFSALPMTIRSFSVSPTVAGARTPRPKKRIVKEQKLQALKEKTKVNRQWTKLDSPLKTAAPTSATKRPTGGNFSRRATSISVTSLQPGSRSPQYEHVFTPESVGKALPKSKRLLVKTGNVGRDKAAAAERQLLDAGAMKRQSGPKVRGFVPVRFALQPIESDVKVTKVMPKSPQQKSQAQHQQPRHATSIDNEPIFAETSQESVEELTKRVGEVRFETMGLHPMVQKGLLELLAKTAPTIRGQATASSNEEIPTSIIKPTEIQALAIPAAIDPNRKSPYTLCAAHTGSGKTLAYLAPILHDLKMQEDAALMEQLNKAASSNSGVNGGVSDEELQRKALNSVRLFYQPRAVVLLPSRELVLQVSETLKQLSHTVKLRTLAIAHPMKPRDVFLRLGQGPVDIVVATPASLTDYLAKESGDSKGQKGHPFVNGPSGKERKIGGAAATLANEDNNLMRLDSLQHLVIDEADTMFDRGFEEDVTKIVKMAKDATRHNSNGRPTRMTVVSATLPKKIAEQLEKLMPNMLKITTPSLHKSLPGLHQTFLDLKPYFGDRKKALLDILANQQRSKQHRRDNTLVFCNTKHSCELLFDALQEKKLPGLVGVLHGDTKARAEMLGEFTSSVSPNSTSSKEKKAGGGAGPVGKILITTDIASRGIDTTMVQHVILYDFPTTIVDYLHRVGRTARGGLGGRATSLVGRKDRNLAERIMLGIRYGKVLS
ncbi:RNA helicase [Actinomortierella wolfii]|nr:RNA helicase [Actinomortierella wolfii]